MNPERAVTFVIARGEDGAVLLERRPPSGIWGGLWCFPECTSATQADAQLQRLGVQALTGGEMLPALRHTFSHFRLTITPLLLDVEPSPDRIADGMAQRWFYPHQADSAALAAPVARLLASLADHRPQ